MPGRMRLGWWTTKNEPRYGLRFQLPHGNDVVIDDLIMENSTEVVISRAGDADGNPINTWFIDGVDPQTLQQAQGVLYRAEGKGKVVRTYEGAYLMPFCMKVEETLN